MIGKGRIKNRDFEGVKISLTGNLLKKLKRKADKEGYEVKYFVRLLLSKAVHLPFSDESVKRGIK